MVRVLEGAFRDFVGAVTVIDRAEKKVLVLLRLFGRPIKTWLTLEQVEKA
jgi:transcription antitermination factor NusG